MRRAITAAWFSVAATGALASFVTLPAVAAETDRPAQALNGSTAQLPLVDKPVQSIDRSATDAELPAQTRLAMTPPGNPRSLQATTATPVEAAGTPLLVAVAPQLTPHKADLAAGVVVAQAGIDPRDKRSSGSLAAAALMMMLVVVFRRRGAIR